MMKILLLILVLLFVSTSCSSRIEQSVNETVQALPSQTSLPTFPPLPTYTPYLTLIPTSTFTLTPTKTATRAITSTLTPTTVPTPLPLTEFKPLDNWEAIAADPDGSKGQLVRALATKSTVGKWLGYEGDYYLTAPDYSPNGIFCFLVPDKNADDSVVRMNELEWMWIYATIIQAKSGEPQLSVIHIDEIPVTKQPKNGGLYEVGIDIEPGHWKSGASMTASNSCYWARIDGNGKIIENYYGVSGINMSVKSTDRIIEFNDECGTMFFLDGNG